jgi:hypothetical protein
LKKQLDSANAELRNLYGEIGRVTAHNQILEQQLKEAQGTRKGRRRREDDEDEEVLPTKRRRTRVRHSSEEEEEEIAESEAARVRSDFLFN